MAERTLPAATARTATLPEARLIVGTVALLAGLALADRAVAWMIGEFPTSAALWELRFEYLRPIAVFYDLAGMSLGAMSGVEFTAFLLAASVTLVAGALSPVRLVRAVSLHALLASLLALCTCSLGFVAKMAAVGAPSSSYALLGAAVALPILGACLRIHAEYLGFDPASSRPVRRFRIAAMRTRDRLGELLAGAIEPLAARRAAVVLARRDVVGNRRARR